jgi:hypothetical protein
MWRIVTWFLRKFFPKKPSPLQSLIEVYDMSNVTLSWVLPVPTARQRPIAGVAIEARVSADLPWTEVAFVEAPATTLVLQDVAPGQWFYRGIVVDTAGAVSPPLNASVEVDFDGPSALVSFEAAVS